MRFKLASGSSLTIATCTTDLYIVASHWAWPVRELKTGSWWQKNCTGFWTSLRWRDIGIKQLVSSHTCKLLRVWLQVPIKSLSVCHSIRCQHVVKDIDTSNIDNTLSRNLTQYCTHKHNGVWIQLWECKMHKDFSTRSLQDFAYQSKHKAHAKSHSSQRHHRLSKWNRLTSRRKALSS